MLNLRRLQSTTTSARRLSQLKTIFKVAASLSTVYIVSLLTISQIAQLSSSFKQSIIPFADKQLELANNAINSMKNQSIKSIQSIVHSSIESTRQAINTNLDHLNKKKTNVIQKINSVKEGIEEKIQIGKDHSNASLAKLDALKEKGLSGYKEFSESINGLKLSINKLLGNESKDKNSVNETDSNLMTKSEEKIQTPRVFEIGMEQRGNTNTLNIPVDSMAPHGLEKQIDSKVNSADSIELLGLEKKIDSKVNSADSIELLGLEKKIDLKENLVDSMALLVVEEQIDFKVTPVGILKSETQPKDGSQPNAVMDKSSIILKDMQVIPSDNHIQNGVALIQTDVSSEPNLVHTIVVDKNDKSSELEKQTVETLSEYKKKLDHLFLESENRPAVVALLDLISKAGFALEKVLRSDKDVVNKTALLTIYSKAIQKVEEVFKEEKRVLQDLQDKLVSEHRLDDLVIEKELKAQKEDLEYVFAKQLFEEKESLALELHDSNEIKLQTLREHFILETDHALKLQTEFLSDEYHVLLDQELQAERSGRQDKVDMLSLETYYLEQLILKNAEITKKGVEVMSLHAALQTIKNQSGKKVDCHDAQALRMSIRNNDLGIEVLDTILDTTPIVLSLSTIQNNFKRVSCVMKRAQFMPSNGGMFSYFGSYLLSHLILPSTTTRSRGCESILARVEYYLDKGDLDSATREMNQIEGVWMRLLMSDWMKDARSYLERKQAIEVCFLI